MADKGQIGKRLESIFEPRQARLVPATDIVQVIQDRQLYLGAGFVKLHHARLIERQTNLVLAKAATTGFPIALENVNQSLLSAHVSRSSRRDGRCPGINAAEWDQAIGVFLGESQRRLGGLWIR